MTSSVANAIAITLDKTARASYDRQVRAEDASAGPTSQSQSEFASTAARLQRLMPGSVKVH